jgi:MFS family permease
MAADLLPSEGMATLFAAFAALMDLGLLLGPTLCLMVLALLRLGARYAFPIMLAPTLIALPLLLSMEETRPPRNPRGESPTADRA